MKTSAISFIKTVKLLLIYLMLLFVFSGCDSIGDQTGTIEYPEAGLYGENLLRKSEIAIVPYTIYSMSAEIDGEASVKVVFPGLVSWAWYLDGIMGWASIESDAYNGRIFYTDKDGTSDTKIEFINSGSMTIEIYENGSDRPVRTKVLTW